MASNFISGPNSSNDLDDVFVLRSDTTLGAPGSTIGTFKYNSTILESKYVRYTEVGLSEPGTPLINPTNFKYNTKDLAYVYVPPQDVQKICSYLTAAGKQKYGYGVPLFAWGANTYGQLGVGDTAVRSSPTQVGTLSDWSKISASDAAPLVFAIKTTGTLWAWGVNTGGALGLNNIVHRSSSVQVGTLTNWQSVACEYYTVAAVKTNGTLWTWGYNFYGQLGLNDTADRSSPTQVGLLTDWKEVNSGTQASAGIKTNGTLWAWGRNNYGAIGNNEPTVDRSSPIQVGSSTSWTSIKVASSNVQDKVFAIQSKTC